MNYDFNRIFLENRQLTNKTVLVWMNIMASFVVFLWTFCILGIVPCSTKSFFYVAPVSALVLITPYLVNQLFHLSDLENIHKRGIQNLTRIILYGSTLSIFLLSCTLSHYVMIMWIFPLIIASQYYSKSITKRTFLVNLIAQIISFIVSLYIGCWDQNFMLIEDISQIKSLSLATLSHAIIYLLPRIILYCASYPLFYSITKRTELLLKKQRLFTMATEAKKALQELQQFPDTFETDCKIKMRYLAKNNIDVDQALSALEGDVDKYNDYILSFVGESHQKEDELFDLLDEDSILQYATKVHALRIKANALGLKNLTDTAFFHEMEAYAGNADIVRLNWEKLSFEWDEACDLFTNYITSLGLRNHASDAQGNQISFQEWGNQLNEAFHALEAYDTSRARKIFNHLLTFQIDSEISNNIRLIVTNIDDILKA